MKLKHMYFHPASKQENNETVLCSFEKKGIPMEKIQSALGRQKRHIASSNSTETSLSMGIEAAKGVLKQSSISIQEIDIIIFVSSTAEHLIPCDSIYIHQALQGKSETMCYD